MENENIIRVRLPKGREVFGYVEKLLGAARMTVRCSDGKVRICKVPGRLLRKMWIKEGMYVIVEPWEIEHDTKGYIIHKYTPTQVSWLKEKGYLKELEDEF